MTTTAQQQSLFDALPAKPYGDTAGHVARDTSVAAAKALEPRLAPLQGKVLLALHRYGPLTDEALDRVCKALKPLRPRRRELELAGYVEDSGDRIQAESGLHCILWALTAKGKRKANELSQ